MELKEKCAMDLRDVTDDFSLLLCGDLNARTASENHNHAQDDCEDVLAKVCDCFPRKSQDNHTNVFGQQLIELCNMCESFILNGLSEHGFDDSCTFFLKLWVKCCRLFPFVLQYVILCMHYFLRS